MCNVMLGRRFTRKINTFWKESNIGLHEWFQDSNKSHIAVITDWRSLDFGHLRKGGLGWIFKYLKWKQEFGLPLNTFFQLQKNSEMRGNLLKLVKHRCSLDLHKFFSRSVFDRQNTLDQHTTDQQTLNGFKRKAMIVSIDSSDSAKPQGLI